ncbi:MAG: TauD/TfdA family dioxygenase [Hyphomonadaceae bacterium]|nr:TauD/TfdA family dioxygenase [Hyphomonadaceae bacterium]
MAISVVRRHPHFFADIRGLDLTRPLTDDEVRLVDAAMTEHAVVAIRGQPISDEDHIRFSRLFGPLELPPSKATLSGRRLRAELYDASNLNAAGEILAPDDPFRQFSKGNELWHTDSSYKPLPTKWSLLRGVIVPPDGGDTEFIDMRAVYAALSPAMQERIEDLVAEHDIWHSRRRAGFGDVSETQRRVSPPAEQPLVRIAADGRKSLYIGAHASHIVGWPIEQGRALLDELYAFATQERFIYGHSWEIGDLVVWDNRCTMHRAGGYESLAHKRDMRRTTNMEYGEENDDPLGVRAAATS